MDMRVQTELLVPSVQHAEKTNFRAEVSRIAAEGEQRVGGRAKQQRVDDARIALGERVQGMRQGEHDVEVLHEEQLGTAAGEPALFRERLALRAVPVAARVVGEALRPTGITRFAMAAERGGAARLDGLHGVALRAGQRVRVAIRRSVGTEDVGDLHRRPRSRARRRGGRRRRGHGLLEAVRLGQIQGRARADEPPLTQMEVPHRRGDLAMAQEALHGVQVDAGFEQVGGKRVAQGVDAALLLDAGAQLGHRVDLLGDGDVDRTRALAIGEEPDARRRALPVRAEIVEEARGQRHVAILGALALLDPHRHAVGIDVGHLEGDRLADAQPGGVDGGQQ